MFVLCASDYLSPAVQWFQRVACRATISRKRGISA